MTLAHVVLFKQSNILFIKCSNISRCYKNTHGKYKKSCLVIQLVNTTSYLVRTVRGQSKADKWTWNSILECCQHQCDLYNLIAFLHRIPMAVSSLLLVTGFEHWLPSATRSWWHLYDSNLNKVKPKGTASKRALPRTPEMINIVKNYILELPNRMKNEQQNLRNTLEY